MAMLQICYMDTLRNAKLRKTQLKFANFPAVSRTPNRLTVAELVGNSGGGLGANVERGNHCHREGSCGAAAPQGVGVGSEYDGVGGRPEVVFNAGGEYSGGCRMDFGGGQHCNF
ncbi:hypothetical protein TB1_024949 [Malus domestica]